MKTIHETRNHHLQWKRRSWWKREFDFYAGDARVAMLSREKRTRKVIGEASDGCWVFTQPSFWKPDLIILALPSQAEIAIVKRGRFQSIAFADGRLLTWKKTSFWGNEWVWMDSEGRSLIHFRHGNHVELSPLAFSLPELSLLVLVGCHLLVLQQEAAAAAAVAASV